MQIKREAVKASINKITKATGADKGILKNITDKLSSGVFKELNINLLEDFPNHKFKIYTDEELNALAENIKMLGLIDPITVWHTDNHYYILCGHNRVRACKIAGFKTVTCNIKNCKTEYEAQLVVDTTNVNRRGGFESLSAEEKCEVIVEDFKALRELYKQDKEKYGLAEVIGFDAKKEVGVYYQLSSTQAAKYYKIGMSFKKDWFSLIPKHFNIKTAYQLAQLRKDVLKEIMNEIVKAESEDNHNIKINESQAKIIKQMENDDSSVEDMILVLYSQEKIKKDKKAYTINFTNEAYAPYYKKIQKTDENILQSIFLKALSDYFDKE